MLRPVAIESSPIIPSTETFTFAEYKSPAWISESFTGSHARRISDTILEFSTIQTHAEGGLDVGFEREGFDARLVSELPETTKFCSTYHIDLRGEGRWWAGPKISVNWQGDEAAKQNGDDWYENYIIEIASSTPDELHEIFTGDYFKAEVLPETTVAGATYKHYKIRFHSWWQFWSVRQDYRATGTLPIKPIVDVWVENGLPTHRIMDGIKANIETYGDIRGTGQLGVNVSTEQGGSLHCDI